MKIITGTLKGMNLATLEGESTRPTSQRVKEAVFSMLQFDIEGAIVLDLFAGCGQMGLEALSRGAKKVIFNDLSKDAINVIKNNIKKAKMHEFCEVLNYGYEMAIRKQAKKENFDIIFIDPPYKLDCIGKILKLLAKNNVLSSNAFVVCESGTDNILNDEELLSMYDVYRKARYSISYITILRLKEHDVQ
ncbi:MAG: 16S rRNA (guanine(966)-N(2))-methyltransferase RsmD [Clostridia bacterium]|nr:16S rRNA (guanine(966)-N(2))-methyltransferase RsmD [Clostridia bacterium]